MPKTHPPMKLSHEEETFLRHWIYEEAHYQEGVGPAKQMQRLRGIPPAELAIIVAATMPSFEEQEAAGIGPPPATPPTWPWSEETTWRARLAEARSTLAQRTAPNQPACESRPLDEVDRCPTSAPSRPSGSR
jgi:hypothetical protein